MLDLDAVDKLVDRVASASLGGARLSKVDSQLTTDADGQDALYITLVLKADDERALTGDTALDLIHEIQRDLRNSGDDRLAIVEFATEGEPD